MGKTKKVMSFYNFMLRYYLREPDRYALAYNLKRLAPRHPELKKINSLADMMIATKCVTDPDARAAITGALWSEYCVRVGRPIIDEE